VTTLDQCLDYCTMWTNAGSSLPYEGVVFNSNLTWSLPHGGNCFLKKNTTNAILNSDYVGLGGDMFAAGVRNQ
jgi:hypothetical protein